LGLWAFFTTAPTTSLCDRVLVREAGQHLDARDMAIA
jgi:hypothetical protein